MPSSNLRRNFISQLGRSYNFKDSARKKVENQNITVYSRYTDSHYTDTSLYGQPLYRNVIIPTQISSIIPTPIIPTKSLMTVIYSHYTAQKRSHYADSRYTDKRLMTKF